MSPTIEVLHECYSRRGEFDPSVGTIVECSPSGLVPRGDFERVRFLLETTYRLLAESNPEKAEELAEEVIEYINLESGAVDSETNVR